MAAIASLLCLGISAIRELGFANAIQTSGVFFSLLVLAFLGSRVSNIAQGFFKRCPKSVRAFVCAFGRFASYLAIGLCGVRAYEQWQSEGDISEVILPLVLFFALLLRDEWNKLGGDRVTSEPK